jgi:hypothetical protein
MSVCSGRMTRKSIEKLDKIQSPGKHYNLKNTKTTISSKSNPFVPTKKNLQYFNTLPNNNSLLLEKSKLHRAETLKIQEEKIMKKFIENYELRPTFFLDQHDHEHDHPQENNLNSKNNEISENNVTSNKDMLRESDIVFEIINKQKTSEIYSLKDTKNSLK